MRLIVGNLTGIVTELYDSHYSGALKEHSGLNKTIVLLFDGK